MKVKELSTGNVHDWTMEQVLEEINRHNKGIPYDESNWFNGWYDLVEYEGDYSIIEGEVKLS